LQGNGLPEGYVASIVRVKQQTEPGPSTDLKLHISNDRMMMMITMMMIEVHGLQKEAIAVQCKLLCPSVFTDDRTWFRFPMR
jgi:hypothetical protein